MAGCSRGLAASPEDLLDEFGFAGGVEVKRLPGEPDGRAPFGEVLAVLLAVAVERLWVGVVLEAVELDDQSVLGIVGVDLGAAQPVVDEPERDVAVTAPGPVAAFEL